MHYTWDVKINQSGSLKLTVFISRKNPVVQSNDNFLKFKVKNFHLTNGG